MWLVRICVVMLYPGICLDLYGVWCAQVPNSWNCTLTRKSCHKAIAAARYSVRILLLCPTCSNIIDDVAGGHWEQSCMKCSLATPPSTPMNLCQLVARWGIFFCSSLDVFIILKHSILRIRMLFRFSMIVAQGSTLMTKGFQSTCDGSWQCVVSALQVLLWRILQYLKSLPVICEFFVQAITRLDSYAYWKCVLTINQIVNWRTHLKFPEEARLTIEAKEFISRLLCDVDHRLGTRGVAEIKVGCHLLDLLWLSLASRMVSRSLLVVVVV